MTKGPVSAGEARHESCRFGALTPAWVVHENGKETATLMPLCLWSVPTPHPPAVDRAWGGLVEFHRDCAVCKAFRPL